jgi:hypothetical protein
MAVLAFPIFLINRERRADNEYNEQVVLLLGMVVGAEIACGIDSAQDRDNAISFARFVGF